MTTQTCRHLEVLNRFVDRDSRGAQTSPLPTGKHEPLHMPEPDRQAVETGFQDLL